MLDFINLLQASSQVSESSSPLTFLVCELIGPQIDRPTCWFVGKLSGKLRNIIQPLDG